MPSSSSTYQMCMLWWCITEIDFGHLSCKNVSKNVSILIFYKRKESKLLLMYNSLHITHTCTQITYRSTNAVFAAAPKTATDKLQHVLNAAARLISDTRKYDQGWHDWSTRIYTAWHSWASQLQTLSTDTSMSPREGSSVPVGLLYTSIQSCCTTPAFSSWSPAGGSATSAQHVRPSGIRCRWPDDLQRSSTKQLSDDF